MCHEPAPAGLRGQLQHRVFLLLLLPDVRHICGNVKLGPWVKVTLRSGHWRAETLIFQPVKQEDMLEGDFGVERGFAFLK